MVARTACAGGHDADKAEGSEIEFVHEGVHNVHWIVCRHVVVEAVGQKRDLMAIRALDEASHAGFHYLLQTIFVYQFGRKCMLEFVCGTDVREDELFITLDAQGVTSLKQAIEHAISSGHDHLYSEAWAGRGLTVTPGEERGTFNKVTITFAAHCSLTAD